MRRVMSLALTTAMLALSGCGGLAEWSRVKLPEADLEQLVEEADDRYTKDLQARSGEVTACSLEPLGVFQREGDRTLFAVTSCHDAAGTGEAGPLGFALRRQSGDWTVTGDVTGNMHGPANKEFYEDMPPAARSELDSTRKALTEEVIRASKQELDDAQKQGKSSTSGHPNVSP